MLDAAGHVKLVDFGLAKPFKGDVEPMSQTGSLIYMVSANRLDSCDELPQQTFAGARSYQRWDGGPAHGLVGHGNRSPRAHDRLLTLVLSHRQKGDVLETAYAS